LKALNGAPAWISCSAPLVRYSSRFTLLMPVQWHNPRGIALKALSATGRGLLQPATA
jgi:hypothetical protein